MLACKEGHQSTAILLLEKGADKQLHNKVSLYIIIIYILCTLYNQGQYQ